MKKKLIKRNKKKYSSLIRKYGYMLRLFYRVGDDDYIRKFKHRYTEIEDFKNASRLFDDDDWISVPISVSSRNKKSRVQNRVHSYLVVLGIDEFNETYGTNLKISDIPAEIDDAAPIHW